MNKTLLATAIAVSTTAVAASPEDIAMQLQQEVYQLQKTVQLELQAEQSPKHAAPQANASYRSYYERIASFSNQSMRMKFAEIFAKIYEQAYQRSQSLIDRINGYNQNTIDYIHKQLWYQRFLDRTEWYKAEAQKYRSILNTVTEISRDVEVTEHTEETRSEPVLVDTTIEEVTEQDEAHIYTYRKTILTYEITVTEARIQTTSTTIHYSNNTSKVETTTQNLSETTHIETELDETKELIKKVELSTPSEEINWNTQEFQTNYGLSMIGVETAYQQGWTGEGVTVAVLDTGLDADHTEFTNVVSGYNFVSDIADTDDDNFHGTHTAGTIAAARDGFGMHGVAFDATIMPIKVLSSTGTGSFANIKNGLAFASNNGAKVANLSLGKGLGYNTTTKDTAAFDWWFGDTYQQVINNDLSIIVAAGNMGYDCKEKASTYYKWEGQNQVTCDFPAALPYLAGYEGLTTGAGGWITVGAVDENSEIAYYSNRAGVMQDFYMVAPGSNIYSTTNDGGYDTYSGTSMATPHVTGAFALLAQKFPYLQGNDIVDILFASATDLGEIGVDEIYGHGLLNITAAMAPIGEMNIPLGDTTTGKRTPISESRIEAPAAFASALMQSAALEEAIIIDDFERAYNVDMTEAVSMMASTYSFDNYRTANVGNFLMGFSELQIDGHHPVVMGYQLTNSTSVILGQEAGIFGAVSDGALSFGDGSTWYSRLGYDNQYKDIRYSLNLDYGFSAGGTVTDSYISNRDNLHGLGFGATARKEIGRDQLVLSFFSPVSVVAGGVDLKVSSGRDIAGNITYTESSLSLKPTAREYTMNMAYSHRIDREQTLNWGLNTTVNAGNVESSFDSGINISYKINF